MDSGRAAVSMLPPPPPPTEEPGWERPDVVLNWKRLVKRLQRLFALRRIWSWLGQHLREYRSLR